MGARRYESDDGRFLQQDFFRNADEEFELSLQSSTENRYGFASGNPVSFVELDGHESHWRDAHDRLRPKPYPRLVYPFPKGYPKRLVQWVHRTDGLPGYPAIDFGAPARAPLLAVAPGRTRWLGGGSLNLDCDRGIYGYNFYLYARSTRIDYYYAHLLTRHVRQGGSTAVGRKVGTIIDWTGKCARGIPNHVHIGATGPATGVNIIKVWRAPQVRIRR